MTIVHALTGRRINGMKRFVCFVLFGLSAVCASYAKCGSLEPTATVKFAQRDSCDLFFDYFAPCRPGSDMPTVVFLFGGGFKGGHRSESRLEPWFRYLNDNGIGVVAIDYRLGMKGKKFAYNLRFVRNLKSAIDIAVEDLFSATDYLIRYGDSLGIDAGKLIVSGSSAGAMTSLQAEWEICNGTQLSSVLPEGFNYKAVIAFAGAIFSDKGPVKYANKPCPQLLFHGTSDNIVPYKKISIFNYCFAGSCAIAGILDKCDANYRLYSMKGNYHEIASNSYLFRETELDFIRRNVLAGEKVIVNATVSDPAIVVPDWARASTAELINGD